VNLWGVAIGREERIDFDEEALYIASLTHDLGITDAYRGHDPQAACFSLDSASAARELVGRHAFTAARVDAVAEAITLHLNAHVPLSHGPEAHLLQIGAAVDVTGFRLRAFDPATREAVLARHPRRAMKAGFAAVMDDEVVLHPDSRPAFFTRRVGFKRMIERAPFDD
jgi:hypothetical protein